MDSLEDPVWLTGDTVSAINGQVGAIFGGLTDGVRDETLLSAAIGRPLNKWHYDDPKPDLLALAAAYCFALIKGHPFHDGNKRTAYIAAIVFLELNGQLCAPKQLDIVRTMNDAAINIIDEDGLTDWFRTNCTENAST